MKSSVEIGTLVRKQLLRHARQHGEDYQLVLLRYANERLLFRLAQSRHCSQFVLKGSTLFTLWTGAPHRATRDIDLLGLHAPRADHLRAIFTELMALEVPDDGVVFDVASLKIEPIRPEHDDGGFRVLFMAHIMKARLRMQIDIGFGDAITPAAVDVCLPTLLDFPKPQLQVYPRETVVAEKVEAMVTLGLINSRMKDFYDLVFLSRSFDFDGELLTQAFAATFQQRGTLQTTEPPVAFTKNFTEDDSKNTQWNAFVRKSGVKHVGDLHTLMNEVARFVQEPLIAVAVAESFAKQWSPGGPWL